MKIHKRNKRYRFKEDRLELCFFVNVEINPTVMEMSVLTHLLLTTPGDRLYLSEFGSDLR